MTYTPTMRMMVYDAIVCKCLYIIPYLITKIFWRCGLTLTEVPQSMPVNQWHKNSGVLSELQMAEVILNNSNCTLGFDATIQEEVHLIAYISLQSFVVPVDELQLKITAYTYPIHLIT